MIYSNKQFITESASSADLGHNPDEFVNKSGLESLSPEDYAGYIPDLGAARSEENSDDYGYGDFFRNPIAMEKFNELMDMSNPDTRAFVLSLNEAEQASVLTALTSRLYDNIVSKVDDIDYGEIPSTKGDIQKLSNYEKLRDCVSILRDILKEYKQNTSPIDDIALAIVNVESNKSLFMRAFMSDAELPIVFYNNIVLNIIGSVSYMISTCIEFIKTPNQDSFKMTLDKVALNKTKNNMMYVNLQKFNKSISNGSFHKSMEFIIKMKSTNAHNEAAAIAGGVLTVIAGVGILIASIYLLREMVFLFYYSKMRISEFLEIQADLLQMNAYNLENDATMDEERKSYIVASQMRIVSMLRKLSNKFAIDNKKAEIDAENEITKENNNKPKPGDVSTGSVLF